MKTNELQKLINECAKIELDNDLGVNFGTDLKKAQLELDALKILNIPIVMQWVAVSENKPAKNEFVWAAKNGDKISKLIKWGTGDESYYDVWQYAYAPKPPCA